MCIRILHTLLVPVLLCSLAACSMAPTYVRPDSPVADAWPSAEDLLPQELVAEGGPLVAAGQESRDAAQVSADAAEAFAMLHWQNFFADPHLQKLISLALNHNRDLRVAALNIEKARGMYQIQRADLLPSINASGQSTNTGLSADLSPTGSQSISHEHGLAVGITSFEIDFFGRIQSLKDEALEQYLGTEEAHKAAQVSLVSSVASAYVALLADRERLKLASDTLISQQASYEMIQKRFELGVSSELDLRQAQISVDTARVDIARYTGQVALDMTALSLLAGTPLKADLLPPASMDSTLNPAELPLALPSVVLLTRPDILQAEHTLKASNANIGAARANFFPRISLTASTGTASDQLQNLFLGPTGTWTFMPQITLPIFQGGRNIATLRVSEAEKQIAVAQYEKAIQSAFQEVSDALIQTGSLREQLKAQQSLTHATSEAYRLSMARYTQGIDNYLTVLDSQRSMYSSQFNLVAVRTNRELNRIMLYKSLGGGWK